ncbi:MAG: outer membrane protein assembly factor [Bacteroidota bacterium]
MLAAMSGLVACAQAISAQPSEGIEIRSLQFDGNDVLSTSVIQPQLLTRETPGFMSKFLYKSISDALGRKNEYYNPVTFSEDLVRLRALYNDHGFYEVHIDSVLRFETEDNTVEIEVNINEGYQSIIDTLLYRGIVHVPAFVWDRMASGRKIAQGDPYNQQLLKSEVEHVLTVLKNAGFPNAVFLPDSSYAVRMASTRNFVVALSFDIGDRFRFGKIDIQRTGDSERHDITDDIILNQLNYEEGSVYSQSEVINSERNLNRVGIFDVARIQVTIPPNDDSSDVVPSRIVVQPADRHELAPELLLSDENGNFNIGTGIGYKSRNFLVGARIFSTRLRFRTQTIGKFPDYFSLQESAISNIDLTFELLQPYIFTNKIKGSWTFSLILDKQRPYRQFIIQNKFGIVDRFAEFTYGYFDWTTQRVELKTNEDLLSNATPKELADLNSQSRQAQFNSIFSFTIQRNKTNDLFSPSSGFVHAATIEEAGLFPLLLKKAQPDLPFTQFYRFILQGKWFDDMYEDRFSILGLKLKAGFEEKYGESRSDPGRAIPQTHRFYAGGGGSVRGWESRKLTATGDPSSELGGNLALEASLELRVNVLRSLRDGFFDKIWMVFFVDGGNVWGEVNDLQWQDVAVATGIGMRYDTFFGPFRIDWGFRVYDPRPDPGLKKWIFRRRFVDETLGKGILHFGIGHAF